MSPCNILQLVCNTPALKAAAAAIVNSSAGQAYAAAKVGAYRRILANKIAEGILKEVDKTKAKVEAFINAITDAQGGGSISFGNACTDCRALVSVWNSASSSSKVIQIVGELYGLSIASPPNVSVTTCTCKPCCRSGTLNVQAFVNSIESAKKLIDQDITAFNSFGKTTNVSNSSWVSKFTGTKPKSVVGEKLSQKLNSIGNDNWMDVSAQTSVIKAEFLSAISSSTDLNQLAGIVASVRGLFCNCGSGCKSLLASLVSGPAASIADYLINKCSEGRPSNVQLYDFMIQKIFGCKPSSSVNSLADLCEVSKCLGRDVTKEVDNKINEMCDLAVKKAKKIAGNLPKISQFLGQAKIFAQAAQASCNSLPSCPCGCPPTSGGAVGLSLLDE